MKSLLRFVLIGPFVLLALAALPVVAAEPAAQIERLIETFEGRWLVRETHEPSAWSPRRDVDNERRPPHDSAR